mgnify:CR=1 FL=1
MITIIKVFESLVKLNEWEVERFDIQAYHYANNKINGYAGYVTIKGIENNLIIHDDGSFEWKTL